MPFRLNMVNWNVEQDMNGELYELRRRPTLQGLKVNHLEDPSADMGYDPREPPKQPSTVVNISRSAYTVEQYNEECPPEPNTWRNKYDRFLPDCSLHGFIRGLRQLFPITLWLPEYNIRQDLIADIVVGITVATFVIPQSIAYCLIAHVPVIYGLYSSFFPPLFYTILGTGHHCSFGTFALVSGVMTGDIVVQTLQELNIPLTAGTTTTTGTTTTVAPISSQYAGVQAIDVAIMAAFIIGIYIADLGVLQFGFISSFMSEEFIKGYIAAAAILTAVSQFASILGISVASYSGPLNLPYTLRDIILTLPKCNPTTLIVSAVTLAILLIFKLGVNRLTEKLGSKLPIPIDLLVIIFGTVASSYLQLNKLYGVKIVGNIGNNFPIPVAPKMELFGILAQKCIAMAIVAYATTYSVAKIMGKKHGYPTDANQELIAVGVCNIASSFFQCIPVSTSLPRSALQDTSGGRTMLVSFFSCLCIIVVILVLGQYLQQLPTCVLGCCIAVALISILANMAEVAVFWRVSKMDCMIWLITFFGVLVISIDIGIYIGLVVSLLSLIYKSSRPKTYLLGARPGQDIYVPITTYNKVVGPQGFAIFQMCGALNFSNVEYFNTELERRVNIDVIKLRKLMKNKKYVDKLEQMRLHEPDMDKLDMIRLILSEKLAKPLPKYLVIDCSMFSFMDWSGINAIKKMIKALEEIGIRIVVTGIHVHIESIMSKEGFFDTVPKDQIYKTVNDAVLTIQEADSRKALVHKGMSREFMRAMTHLDAVIASAKTPVI